MKKVFLLILVAAFCFSPADAQKRRKAVKKVVEVVPEKTPEEELFEELLPSTAKVMFVDSVVVDKALFLSLLPMASEMGRVHTDGDIVSYTNGFGNTSIYAEGDTIRGRHLYMTHLYGKKWSEPAQLTELPQPMADYPFLMGDGVTLYFSAEGEGTLGGRDIYRTTYDASGSHFYEAVNMGMPYNSPANDYMLAISDYDNLGWLVTDRYQPEGKVCIYTFEPTAQRQTFDEDTDTEILTRYARLEHIKDTWAFGDANEAIQRRDAMIARINSKEAGDKVMFVVNDNTVYTSLDDFHTPSGKKLYQALMADKGKLAKLQSLLDSTRESYADAARAKKYEIGRSLNALEQEVEALENDIAQAEKTLRNAENK